MKLDRRAPLFLTALLLAACSGNADDKKTAPPPVPVATAQATARDVPLAVDVVGRAEAFESVTLKARVDGQVAAVLFTEGQRVAQGEVLVRLDPTDFTARVRQAEASVARDEALLAKAHADTLRYVALKGRNFVSEEKVNEVRTGEAAAAATLRADQAALDLARAQLSYATVRAPFAGVVGARLVFPGSAIKTNDTALAVVNRVRPLLVSFSVPEKHLPRLRAALAAGKDIGALKVAVSLPGDSAHRFEGAVRFLDNAVDAATGTIQMKAELPNVDEKLTPGQFLSVSLQLDTLRQAVTVPNEAVQQGPEGNFIFVVKADSSVEVRKVEAGASTGGLTVVAKGLQAGETVVTDGQLRLTPGARIRSKEDAPAPAATATADAARS
ncbi:MAG: efflux RND transporter periplasmic adaptor subunit [Candidatus Accumulibacter sp.]|nr:efflux RND transporter periplasmic adaptor subunit [Accumulibacter sp.]MBA4092806.1 efflux RND transporter periplasmic adaptor subunit [Accumulibacter sp.]